MLLFGDSRYPGPSFLLGRVMLFLIEKQDLTVAVTLSSPWMEGYSLMLGWGLTSTVYMNESLQKHILSKHKLQSMLEQQTFLTICKKSG